MAEDHLVINITNKTVLNIVMKNLN